jgi:hypothetical protein
LEKAPLNITMEILAFGATRIISFICLIVIMYVISLPEPDPFDEKGIW